MQRLAALVLVVSACDSAPDPASEPAAAPSPDQAAATKPTPSPSPSPSEAPTLRAGPRLLDEPFETAAALTGWRNELGARYTIGRSGEAAATIAWDAGRVRFEGTPATTDWPMLMRVVDVSALADEPWLRLSGQLSTEQSPAEVAAAGHVNCNLFVKHPGGLIPTVVVTGTNGPTPISRIVQLPPGTKEVSVGVFCSVPGRAWFDDVVLEALPDGPNRRFETDGHFQYITLGDDRIPSESRAFNEESYRVLSEFFGAAPPRVPNIVNFYKYPDVTAKAAFTGRGGNAHRDGKDLHTIWPSDRHELVHIFADTWGDPPALLAEGLAVHLSGAWQDLPVRSAAKQLRGGAGWVDPGQILDSSAFRSRPDTSTYPISGAFVAWIVESRDVATLQAAYAALPNKNAETANRAALERVLGGSMVELDAAFAAWVDAG